MKNIFYILAILLLLPSCGGKRGNSTRSAAEAEKSLFHAASSGDINKVKELIAAGVNVNAKTKHNVTPLHWAALEGHLEIVKLLVASGADLEAVDKSGDTPLHAAAITHELKVVEFLVAKGVDPDIRGPGNLTPLHKVAGLFTRGLTTSKHSPSQIARFLISKGADVNARDCWGITPLHRAVQADDEKMAELLISKGADVNATDNERRTPLDLALECSCVHVLSVLRRHGGRTAKAPSNITEAAMLGDIAKVKEFLAAGADADSRNPSGETALFYAALNGDRELAELLISHGADVTGLPFANPPFEIAIKEGHVDIVELLISKGADVNVEFLLSGTPLHLAVKSSRKEIAGLLIFKGCKINVKDDEGKTALDLARTEEMKKLLCKHGAVSGKELNEGEGE